MPESRVHVFGTLAFLLLPASALACSLLGPLPLSVDPELEDATPPQAPVVERVAIRRATGPNIVDGQVESSSCDDVGWITLVLDQPPGDAHRADEIGYLLERAEGTLPEGLVLAAVPWVGDTLVLPWLDVGDTRDAAVDFVLRVTPVDEAANRGEAVEVRITDASTPGSCGGCGLGLPAGFVPLAGALLPALRRRERAWNRGRDEP